MRMLFLATTGPFKTTSLSAMIWRPHLFLKNTKLAVCTLKRIFGCSSWLVTCWTLMWPLWNCFSLSLLRCVSVHRSCWMWNWSGHCILSPASLNPYSSLTGITIDHFRRASQILVVFQSHHMLRAHSAISSYSYWFDFSVVTLTFLPNFFEHLPSCHQAVGVILDGVTNRVRITAPRLSTSAWYRTAFYLIFK